MTAAAELVAEALAAGLLLSRCGEQLHVDSPLGRPLSAGLRARLQASKDELLAYLDWCERADRLLLDCSRRLGESCPCGCPLGGKEWRAAEEAVHDAYRSADEDRLRLALAAYESFAKTIFRDYTRRVR